MAETSLLELLQAKDHLKVDKSLVKLVGCYFIETVWDRRF